MITYKTSEEIEILKKGGEILANILKQVSKLIKPGVKISYLNDMAENLALEAGAESSFKGYKPQGHLGDAYPCGLCVSLNDEVVHGIGIRDIIIKDGDLVSLDMGIKYKNLFTDSALTVIAGKGDKQKRKLVEVTKKALYEGINQIKHGNFVSDISKRIQKFVEQNGFSVVRELVGHGVGYSVHEDPAIFNYYEPVSVQNIELKTGMVLALEPMVTQGGWRVKCDKDKWTFRTKDGSLAAHFEHTIAVTGNGYKILTN